MVIFPREKLRAEQTHKIISFFAKSGIFHFLSVFNKITHLFSVQEVHITAQAMFGRLFKSFVICLEPFMNPEKQTSICFILVTVLTEYLDGADMLNLALCLSSVSAPGMYLAIPYQTGVCISPTKILHQAASPSAVYVSHQAEYCTKHYPVPTDGMYLTSTISPTRNGYHTQRGPTPSVGSVLNRCVLTE